MNEVEQESPKTGGMLSINNLPGGVGVYELADEIRATYMSRGLAKLLSYTPHEFHIYNELDLLQSVHERERHRVRAVFKRLKKSHKELDISFRLQRDENKYLRVLGRYSRHHGQYPVYYLVASDISEAHQNALALERQNTRLHFAFSHSTLEMWEYHIDENRLIPLSRTILGGHPPMQIKNPQSYLLDEGYVRQDFKTSLIRDFTLLKKRKEPDSILAIRTSDGSYRWLRLSYAFLSEGEDSPNRAIGIFQDVNDEIVMRLKALGQEKAFFGGFNLENGSPVLADDRVWLMMDDHEDFYQMYEVVLQGAIQESYRSLFEDIDTIRKLKQFVSDGNKELTIEAKMMHPFHQEDGYRWVRFHFSVSLANNTQIGYIAIRDIDETKMHEQALEKRAHRDGLTGIYNRFSLEDMVSKYLKTPGNKAFFLIDIDHFKLINDTYGHDMGDRVLIQFTNLIEDNFPQGTIIGRLGGDEFVAFLSDDADSVLYAWNRLQNAISKENSLGFQFSCSAGFCLSPEHGTSFSELYQHADLALYHSKNHGRNQCTRYVSEMGNSKRLCLTNHEWMLDNLPDTVYLSDMENYDLLFLNKAGRERHSPESRYMGRKCYEVIFHRDSVCEHCRLHSLSYNDFSFWNYQDEEGNVWLCKEKLILFNERPAKLSVLVDQLKQAREIAQQEASEYSETSITRAAYFRELQWGGSSWDYDSEHDILTLVLFSHGKPNYFRVEGYLKEGKSLEPLYREDRSLFRKTLTGRMQQNNAQPLQIRLQLFEETYIPVLFQWLFIQDDKSRVGGKVLLFNPTGFSVPETTLPSILNEFTVSLFVFALEGSRQTLIFANKKFLEIFQTTYQKLEQHPMSWLPQVERTNLIQLIHQMQKNNQQSDTHLIALDEERYFLVAIHIDVCYGLSQLVSLSIQDASNE